MKLIRQLENLAFGTRLRLLTERVLQDSSMVYKSLDMDFEPRWFALFYLLNESSPIAVTEAAAMLGYTQPAITQTANLMIKKGLIRTLREKNDTRKKLLALAPRGKEMVANLKPVWKAFEEATNELFKDTGIDVIMVFDKIEKELDKKDLFTRISEKVKTAQRDMVQIVEYKPEYKTFFKDLNYEWLNKYFHVEQLDKKILSDPESNILKKGGHIFFGMLDEEIVGTAALLNHGNRVFEIAKMAVTERAQGRQIGRKLAVTAIEKARSKKGSKIFLETNRKLTSALNLYRGLGFEQVEATDPSKYERPTIKLELKLN